MFNNNYYQKKINEKKSLSRIFYITYILKYAKFIEQEIILEICIYMHQKLFFCVFPAKQVVQIFYSRGAAYFKKKKKQTL